jgi:hypothetical protein
MCQVLNACLLSRSDFFLIFRTPETNWGCTFFFSLSLRENVSLLNVAKQLKEGNCPQGRSSG